jgi:hypothetical protein
MGLPCQRHYVLVASVQTRSSYVTTAYDKLAMMSSDFGSISNIGIYIDYRGEL